MMALAHVHQPVMWYVHIKLCECPHVNSPTCTCPMTWVYCILYVALYHMCRIPYIQVVQMNTITICESDVERVESGDWINDSVVDMYVWFLQAKADATFFFMGSFFWKSLCRDVEHTAKRWRKNEKLLVWLYPIPQLLHVSCTYSRPCAICIVWNHMHTSCPKHCPTLLPPPAGKAIHYCACVRAEPLGCMDIVQFGR